MMRDNCSCWDRGSVVSTEVGTVISRNVMGVEVSMSNGTTLLCTFRGKLRRQVQQRGLSISVGDRVSVTPIDNTHGVVEDVLTRVTQVERLNHRATQVLAANVDQVVIVVAAREPLFRPAVVERYLIVARHAGVGAIVVINKADLSDHAELETWVDSWRSLGTPCLFTSTKLGTGLDALRNALSQHVSVLIGPSGVGKTSLLRCLVPNSHVRVGRVSAATGKGRHTTTTSRLYAIADGGFIVDTPGLKALGMWEMTDEVLEGVFPDIVEAGKDCHYRNCRHVSEPGCAVRKAVAMGVIEERRYRNFLRIRDDG